MTRFYCDYCATYLTHDSYRSRKEHNWGFKHRDSVHVHYRGVIQGMIAKGELPSIEQLEKGAGMAQMGMLTQMPMGMPGMMPGMPFPQGMMPPPNMSMMPPPNMSMMPPPNMSMMPPPNMSMMPPPNMPMISPQNMPMMQPPKMSDQFNPSYPPISSNFSSQPPKKN